MSSEGENLDIQQEEAATEQNEDLFGEDDEIFVKEEDREGEQDQFEEQSPEEIKRITLKVSVPDAPPNNGLNFMFKVPNFLAFDPVEYNTENFEPLEKDPSDPDSALKARHRLQHTVRWRKGQQSNTRICKWNNGSYTIKVGHKHFPITLAKHRSHIYWRHGGNILETDTRKFEVDQVMSATPNGTVYNMTVAQEQEAKSKTRFISEFNDPQMGRKVHEQLEQARAKQLKQAQNRERRSRNYNSDEEDDILLLGRGQQELVAVADEYDKDFVVDDDEGLEEYDDDEPAQVLSSEGEDIQQQSTPKKVKMVIDDDDE